MPIWVKRIQIVSIHIDKTGREKLCVKIVRATFFFFFFFFFSPAKNIIPMIK